MPPLILVAEDYPVLQALFRTLFTTEGYTVEVVATGIALVARARAARPDLILTDVAMPGMSGIAATSMLRANPVTAHVPIVVQSADPSYAVVALDAGANAFFVKPANLDELLATVQQLITTEAPHVHA